MKLISLMCKITDFFSQSGPFCRALLAYASLLPQPIHIPSSGLPLSVCPLPFVGLLELSVRNIILQIFCGQPFATSFVQTVLVLHPLANSQILLTILGKWQSSFSHLIHRLIGLRVQSLLIFTRCYLFPLGLIYP